MATDLVAIPEGDEARALIDELERRLGLDKKAR